MCKHCVSHAWFHKREGSEETNCLKYLLNHSLSSSCFSFFFFFLCFPLLSPNLPSFSWFPTCIFLTLLLFLFHFYSCSLWHPCFLHRLFQLSLPRSALGGLWKTRFSLPAALLWLVLFQIRSPKDFLSRLTALWAPCKSRLCTTLMLLLIHSLLLLSSHSEKLFFSPFRARP